MTVLLDFLSIDFCWRLSLSILGFDAIGLDECRVSSSMGQRDHKGTNERLGLMKHCNLSLIWITFLGGCTHKFALSVRQMLFMTLDMLMTE